MSRRKKDAPAPNVSGAIRQILGRNPKLPEGPLGLELGRMLAEIAVELQDKIDEAKGWKLRFEALRGELRTLVAILIRQRPGSDGKLVITRKEFEEIPDGLEVAVEAPEAGVRIYRLVDRSVEPELPKVLQ